MACAVPGAGAPADFSAKAQLQQLLPGTPSLHAPASGPGQPWAPNPLGPELPQWVLHCFRAGRQGHRLPWAPRRGAWGTGLRVSPGQQAWVRMPNFCSPHLDTGLTLLPGSLKRGQDLEPLWGGRTQALVPAQPAGRQPHLPRASATGKPSPAPRALSRASRTLHRRL